MFVGVNLWSCSSMMVCGCEFFSVIFLSIFGLIYLVKWTSLWPVSVFLLVPFLTQREKIFSMDMMGMIHCLEEMRKTSYLEEMAMTTFTVTLMLILTLYLGLPQWAWKGALIMFKKYVRISYKIRKKVNIALCPIN